MLDDIGDVNIYIYDVGFWGYILNSHFKAIPFLALIEYWNVIVIKVF